MSCRWRRKMSSKSLLQEPWLSDEAVHLQKENILYLHHQSEEDLGETVAGILAFEKPADVSHLLQEQWAASCAEVCCCHWSHSNCWPFHSWYLPQQDPSSIPGATVSSGDWSKGWPPAPHRCILCQPPYHCFVYHRVLCAMWTLPSHVTTRELT